MDKYKLLKLKSTGERKIEEKRTEPQSTSTYVMGVSGEKRAENIFNEIIGKTPQS